MRTDARSARVSVRLTPRAGRDEVLGFDGDVLRVRVAAPPVDGRANEALTRLLAARLDVPRSAIEVVGGHTARTKVVAIEGLDAAEVRARLGLSGGA
ncbi:MAG: DUF167 domain-containing protein [Dehalococcoidia bacterium]